MMEGYTPAVAGSMRKLLRTRKILTPRDAGDGPPRRAGVANREWVVGWWIVRSGRERRRSRAASRRCRRFEIWARMAATMGKGSAGVLEKESKKQRMVEIGGRTAIRSSERRRAEEKNSRDRYVH
jgi:hypothetical protein